MPTVHRGRIKSRSVMQSAYKKYGSSGEIKPITGLTRDLPYKTAQNLKQGDIVEFIRNKDGSAKILRILPNR